MKVNFNNIRRQLLNKHDKLVKKLNRAIIKNDEQYAVPNDVTHGQQVNLKGYILIDPEDIDELMNDLRMLIGTTASVFEEGNDDFKDVFSETYEGDDSMAVFNPEVNE